MSRDSGPERTQRTVAELLAQHGASTAGSRARRRRRRSDEGDESAPKAIIDRVLSDSGRLRQVGNDDPAEPEQPEQPAPEYPAAEYPAPEYPAPEYPALQQPPAALRQASPREATPPELPVRDDSWGYRRDDSFVPRRDDAPPTELLPPTDPTPPRRGGGAGRSGYRELPDTGLPQARPAVPPAPATPGDAEVTAQYAPITESTPPPRPAAGFRSSGRLPRPLVPPEPSTQQIPRITQGLDPNLTTEIPAIPALPPGRGSGGPETESWFHEDGFVGESIEENGSPEAYHEGQYQDEYYEDGGYAQGEYDQDEFDDGGAEHGHIAVDEAAAEAAGEDLLDEEYGDEEYGEEETKRSPAKEWLVMVTQLGAGVLGGGGIWLGFQYLWRALPAVALGVAVVITVGLVWMVRRIRRADDLQTIVLAVLVGLVVTVSPAALLLVGR